MILFQSEFYLSAAVRKRYECSQQDVRKIGGTSLRNAKVRVRRSQKNSQATDEERCQGEIELHSLEKENEEMENNSGTG